MSNLYVKLDAEYAADDKLIEAGPLAELLYVRGLAFSMRTMSDGRIRSSQLASVGIGIPSATKHAQRLVEVGAWEATSTGWRICAWLKRNKSAEQIEGLREQRRLASVEGNHSQHHVGPGKKSSPKCELCHPNLGRKPDPPPDPHRTRIALQELEPEPEPDVTPEPEPEPEPSSSSHDGFNNADPLPVDKEDPRVGAALEAIVASRINGRAQGENPSYRKVVAKDVRTAHLAEVTRLADAYPKAPPDVLAASATGDKHSLRFYAT